MDEHFIGLKLLSIFSIGCIGSGQMFLPIFYKKVLGLGNDKIGLIFSISKVSVVVVVLSLATYFFFFYSAVCFIYSVSLLDSID